MVYLIGPYRLDTSLPLLLRGTETVPIPPRALAGLVLLVERHRTAVTKRELMETLWADTFVEEGSLTQLVSTLRKVLADGFDQTPIQTIPKIGYRFVAEVRQSEALHTPADHLQPPATHTLISEPPLPIVPRRLLWQKVSVMFGVVTLLVGVATWRLHRPGSLRTQEPAEQYALAVLPFQNLSASPESAWVGTAVQEMLSTDLRLSHSLQVLPTDDVNRALKEVHWNDSADPGLGALRSLASDLDCDRIVTGAYLLKGGRVRLDLRVINLTNGRIEQESSVSRPEDELLQLLAEVSARNFAGLGVNASEAEEARNLSASLNPAAYKLYAEAVAHNRVYDFKRAISLLQEAISLDPGFSAAHFELSMAWSASGQEKKAVVEADRALQLSDHLPRQQQLLVQGRVQSAKHDFAHAAETYRALFSFFPHNREYGRLLVQSLSSAGHSDDALSEAQQLLASSRDASSDPLLLSVVADVYSTLGDWSSSLEWATRGAEESRRRGATILLERLLTTESQANFYLGRYATAQRQTDKALVLARQYGDISGELRALNRQGQIDTAQKLWASAESALLAAEALEQEHDQLQRQTHTLLALSHLKQAEGDLQHASLYGWQARELAEKLGYADVTAEAKLQLAILDSAKGKRNSARLQLASVRNEAATLHDAYLQEQATKSLQSLR